MWYPWIEILAYASRDPIGGEHFSSLQAFWAWSWNVPPESLRKTVVVSERFPSMVARIISGRRGCCSPSNLPMCLFSTCDWWFLFLSRSRDQRHGGPEAAMTDPTGTLPPVADLWNVIFDVTAVRCEGAAVWRVKWCALFFNPFSAPLVPTRFPVS